MSDVPPAEPTPPTPLAPAEPRPSAPAEPTPPPTPPAPAGPPKGRFLRLVPGLPMPGDSAASASVTASTPASAPVSISVTPRPTPPPTPPTRPTPVTPWAPPTPPPRSNAALIVIISAVGLALFACVVSAIGLSFSQRKARLAGRPLPTTPPSAGRAAYPSAAWSPPAFSGGIPPVPDEPSPSAEELFERGQAFARGDGVDPDAAVACRCYKQAADLGHARARAYLAWCLESGTGTPRDPPAAERAWTEAAMDGDWLAIGRCHELRHGAVTLGPDEAMNWYRTEAVDGDALAMLLCGLADEVGSSGTGQDLESARSWYARGAKLGDAACLERLGALEDDGAAARAHLARAAALGRPAANLALAALLEGGRGGPVDEAGAVACLRSGAAASDPVALVALARHLEAGWGTPADPAEATRLLERAAAAGDEPALVEQALWLELGLGSAKEADPRAARRLLEKALREGREQPAVRVALARMLLEGRGGKAVDAQGRDLLARAGADPYARFARAVARLEARHPSPVEALEELDDLTGVVPCAAVAWARFTLADAGAPGEDRERAGRLLRAAARCGDGRAARELQAALERGALAPAWEGELGHWFAEAETVAPAHGGGDVCVAVLHPVDVPPLARRALERAALSGDPDAMRELADMLREGRGGPVNEVVADDWLRRAGAVDPQGPERR